MRIANRTDGKIVALKDRLAELIVDLESLRRSPEQHDEVLLERMAEVTARLERLVGECLPGHRRRRVVRFHFSIGRR